MGTRPFLEEVPHYVVVDGVMQVTAGDFALAMPLRAFRQAMVRAQRALDEYDAKRAVVVPMRKGRKGGHS